MRLSLWSSLRGLRPLLFAPFRDVGVRGVCACACGVRADKRFPHICVCADGKSPYSAFNFRYTVCAHTRCMHMRTHRWDMLAAAQVCTQHTHTTTIQMCSQTQSRRFSSAMSVLSIMITSSAIDKMWPLYRNGRPDLAARLRVQMDWPHSRLSRVVANNDVYTIQHCVCD